MDDEEDFLPKSKKPKLHASKPPTSTTSSSKTSAMDMSWMEDEKREEVEGKEASSEGNKKDFASTPRPASPLPPHPSSSQSSSAPSSQAASSQQNSSSQASMKGPKPKQALAPSTHAVEGTPRWSKVWHIETMSDMKEEVSREWKERKESESALPSRSIILLPSHLSSNHVQEMIDIMIETVEGYTSQEREERRKSQKMASSSPLLSSFWYSPPTATHAAAFRRRMEAMKGGESEEERKEGVALSSILRMVPPSLDLHSTIEHIAKVEANDEKEGEKEGKTTTKPFFVIFNDSNWRFKGVGAKSSFHYQIHSMVDDYLKKESEKARAQGSLFSLPSSLSSLIKSRFPVGEPGKSYPVKLPDQIGRLVKLEIPSLCSKTTTSSSNSSHDKSHISLDASSVFIFNAVAPIMVEDSEEAMKKEDKAKWASSLFSSLSSLPSLL